MDGSPNPSDGAARVDAFHAVERAARDAFERTSALAERGADRVRPASVPPPAREAAAESRDLLRRILDCAFLDPAVREPARALLDRLDEGALELDLSLALGDADPAGAAARARAEQAIHRDARALARALECCLDGVRASPSVDEHS